LQTHPPFQILTSANAGLTWKISNPPWGWSKHADIAVVPTVRNAGLPCRASGCDLQRPVIETTHDGGERGSPCPFPPSPGTRRPPHLEWSLDGRRMHGRGVRADHFIARRYAAAPRTLSPPVASSLPAAEEIADFGSLRRHHDNGSVLPASSLESGGRANIRTVRSISLTQQVSSLQEEARTVSDSTQQSPVIWRCALCGSLVHPSDERTPVAWCPRCRRITQAVRDGGS
jgi:hypothetical protein